MKSRLLISIAIFLFLSVGTYIAIKWAQGYRLNFSKKTFESTGLLVANSQPQGASVYIDNELKSATNDTLHLPPNDYKIRLEKDGYSTWEKLVKIEKELVTQTNARLFPSVPNLSALTVNSATNPAPSPDGNKIAYKIATGSAQTKYGIWVINLNDNPLRTSSNAIQIAQDTSNLKFSQAQIFWTPSSSELVAYFNENQMYVLNTNQLNKSETLINAAFQLPSLISEWKQQLALEKSKRLLKLPDQMQEIATNSATLVYFSPNEEKLLYTATNSASLKDHLLPPLPAINSQPQSRDLIPGNVYIYDLKEDTNYLIKKDVFDQEKLNLLIQMFALPKFDPQEHLAQTLPPMSPVNNPLKTIPLLDQLKALQLHYSPIYANLNMQWFPSSNHLIITQDHSICIMEYDGTNKVTVFPATSSENFAYPWPNGQKLIILTSLTDNGSIPSNLYTLNLE
jgi:hypothetical protein